MSIRLGARVKIIETGEEGEVAAILRFGSRSTTRMEYSVKFEKPNSLGDKGYRCAESDLLVIKKPRAALAKLDRP